MSRPDLINPRQTKRRMPGPQAPSVTSYTDNDNMSADAEFAQESFATMASPTQFLFGQPPQAPSMASHYSMSVASPSAQGSFFPTAPPESSNISQYSKFIMGNKKNTLAFRAKRSMNARAKRRGTHIEPQNEHMKPSFTGPSVNRTTPKMVRKTPNNTTNLVIPYSKERRTNTPEKTIINFVTKQNDSRVKDCIKIGNFLNNKNLTDHIIDVATANRADYQSLKRLFTEFTTENKEKIYVFNVYKYIRFATVFTDNLVTNHQGNYNMRTKLEGDQYLWFKDLSDEPIPEVEKLMRIMAANINISYAPGTKSIDGATFGKTKQSLQYIKNTQDTTGLELFYTMAGRTTQFYNNYWVSSPSTAVDKTMKIDVRYQDLRDILMYTSQFACYCIYYMSAILHIEPDFYAPLDNTTQYPYKRRARPGCLAYKIYNETFQHNPNFKRNYRPSSVSPQGGKRKKRTLRRGQSSCKRHTRRKKH